MTASRITVLSPGRALAALAAGVALALLLASSALAAAGGGSSGFSGGGGGGGSSGGFGGGGGGYGGGSSGPGDALVGGLILIAFVVFVLYWLYRQAVNAFVAQRLRIRRGKRVKRVEAAAAEAAQDDSAFAADAVRSGAERLFRTVQAAWSANDVATLDALVADELMVEWRRRLGDFRRKGWRNVVEVQGTVGVEYVGLVNRVEDADDRCVVRIEARLRDYVVDGSNGRKLNRTGSSSEFTTLKEYWTLGKSGDGGWRLLSIEQDAEGAHHIDAAIVASPWGDDQRLRDEALVEGAVADKVVDGYRLAEIADLDFAGDARTAALDLSLADARFAPDILETAARRAVGGWAEAVDGEDDELLAVATPDAVRELLHPGGSTGRRLVVRGPRIERVQIASLDAAAEPATMTVVVRVRGRRYVQDRDTAAIVSGSDSRETSFTERWLMALSGDDRNPWRIVDADAPAAAGNAPA